MRTDRELLELAAKAAGIELKWATVVNGPQAGAVFCRNWHPLADDGDALRLAVKLDLLTAPRMQHERDVLMFTKSVERLESTRRAIVIAAAEIGAAMP